MTTQIPNLWPETIERTEVLTPIAILKTQSAELSRMTKGILRGEVKSEEEGGLAPSYVGLTLDVVAPALNGERREIVTVFHSPGLPYPCWIGSPHGQPECGTDEELLCQLGNELKKSRVVSMIQSLIARSNEVGDPSHAGT